MNILYISKLDGRPWIGPTYSVPRQIAAQTKYDNVLWYNLMDEGVLEGKDHLNNWRKLTYYKDLLDFPKGKIAQLPEPFNQPDLIVVEQNYPYAKDKIRYEILRGHVPYIIIPRGELTEMAQRKKRLKKLVGNILLNYYGFVSHAVAVQCLTEDEKQETSHVWHKEKIVLPNGTERVEMIQHRAVTEGIKCVFIGRLEPYQKGLDLLVQACIAIKDKLIEAKWTLSLYGSDAENKALQIKEMVQANGLSDMITFHQPVFNEAKKEVLKQSDSFVLTSRFEGHPTGLLEALAYGLPCLVTKGTNMREEVEAYQAGWGADDTAESIKDALLTMISEKERIVEKGNHARQLAKNYEWDTIAEKTHAVYAHLITGKGKA